MKILILHYSKTGHTLEAAHATAEGIRSAGSEAELVSAKDFRASMLTEFDGLIIGSPCWGGNITSGVAKPILRIVKSLASDSLKGKRGGGIAVHAMSGGESTVASLGKLLSRKGCGPYQPGPVAKAGRPLSFGKGSPVSAQDIERFKAYGAEFVA